MLRPAVTVAAIPATSRMYSGRRRDSSSTSTAPANGTTISIDRIGKSREFTCGHSTGECASQNSPADDEPGEQQHDTDAQDLGVVADVAGLAFAQLAGGAGDGATGTHHGTVDDPAVEPRQRVERLATGAAHEGGHELVVLPTLRHQRRLDRLAGAP